MKTTSTPQISLTIDITGWSSEQRDDLISAVNVIESRIASTGTQIADAETTGWTLDAYMKVMEGLLDAHFAQAKVINEGIANGTGYVSRAQVYDLAGYPESRSLKGFTRPVNRFMDEQVEAGLLPDDAAPLLEPDYDPALKGYQRARGFRVPLEVVRILQENLKKQQELAGP